MIFFDWQLKSCSFDCSQKLGDVKIGPDESTGELQTGFQRGFNKVVWLVGTSRNAIMVVVCGIVGFYLFRSGADAPDQLLVYIGESASISSKDVYAKQPFLQPETGEFTHQDL